MSSDGTTPEKGFIKSSSAFDPLKGVANGFVPPL
jgi:hypothetical protein